MGNRQLRKRKESPVRHTPTILDDIVVCWEVEGCPVWWPASVIEVHDHEHPKGNEFGFGKLLYKKFRQYQPEEADVRFIYTNKKGHIIIQGYESKMLQMSWSHSPPESKVEPTKSKTVSNGPATKLAKVSPSAKIEPVLHLKSSSEPSDSQYGIVNSTSSLPTVQISGFNSQGLSNTRQAANSGSSNDAVNPRVSYDQVGVIAQTTSAIVEQLLTSNRKYMARLSSDSFHDHLRDLVMHELRIDLVTELHRHFKTPQSLQKFQADLQQRSLRTSVSCPLHTFSSLASMIRESTKGASVHFFPAFEQTQNPSISSDRFTIYFSTVHDLCAAIGFNDNRDFETLHFREKCHDGTYYTRIIGSLSLGSSINPVPKAETKISGTTLSEKKTCTTSTVHVHGSDAQKGVGCKEGENDQEGDNTDIIFVGCSLNAKLVDRTIEQQSALNPSVSTSTEVQNILHVAKSIAVTPVHHVNSQNSSTASNCVALARKRALWDDETGDFLSHWESHTNNICVTPPENEFFDNKKKKLEGVFALRWEPKSTPRTSAWTADALRSGNHILGRLEVFIPWVLLSGAQCAEVGDIISKHNFRIRS